jgi:Rrf2 family protein
MALMSLRRERLSVREMAELLHVSEAHLSKVLQQLFRKGLVISHRGPRGGFELALPPESISLMDIYEALEGSPQRGVCLLNCRECPFGKCFLGEPIHKMEQEFVAFLRDTTLAAVRERERDEK